jgi:threonyl-tRNA synthetase
MIKISFPDNSIREYQKGITPMDIAKDISEGFARNILSANFNNNTVELSTFLSTDGSLKFFTWNDPEGKNAFWHSSAHVLAQALIYLYPKCKLTIGPAIEKGFYYDADFGDKSLHLK